LANTLQAKKRVRQNEKRRQHNSSHRSRIHTLRKRVAEALAEKDMQKVTEEYRKMTSYVDKMAHKKLVAKNWASRLKSRIATIILLFSYS
jgi:small subunit ribosomal protein S20